MTPDSVNSAIDKANRDAFVSALAVMERIVAPPPVADDPLAPFLINRPERSATSSDPYSGSRNTYDSAIPHTESSRQNWMSFPPHKNTDDDAPTPPPTPTPTPTPGYIQMFFNIINENELLDDTSDVLINGVVIGRFTGAENANQTFEFSSSLLNRNGPSTVSFEVVVDNDNGNYFEVGITDALGGVVFPRSNNGIESFEFIPYQ
jgi:hypothetical protein